MCDIWFGINIVLSQLVCSDGRLVVDDQRMIGVWIFL